MTRCTLIADSLLSGEPLSDGDRAHLATCADCARLAKLPRIVAATALAPEPGPGFASRVAAGARERMAARKRQRVIGLSLATAAAAGLAVYVVGRDHDRPADKPNELIGAAPEPDRDPPSEPDPSSDETEDDELRELARRLSDPHLMAPVADWDEIEAPLESYRAVLVRGGTP